MDGFNFEKLENNAYAKYVMHQNELFILNKTRQVMGNMIELMNLFIKMDLLVLLMLVILRVTNLLTSEKIVISIFSILMCILVICNLTRLKYDRKQQLLDTHIDDLEIKYAVQALNDKKEV